MTSARTARLRVLAAAAGVVTAWLVAPHAVPLYDGLGIPDEPYRYVTPPAGYQQTPPPSSVSSDLPAVSGTNERGLLVQTKEQSSQVGMFIVPKSLSAPAATKTFTLKITAEAPDGPTPGGVMDGNMYKVELLADGAPTATLSDSGKDTIPYVQRATSAKIADETLYYRANGGSWASIPVAKGSSTDSFTGFFAGAGDYALVPTTAKAANSSSHLLIIVILVLVILAMVGAVVLIRASRRPPAQT